MPLSLRELVNEFGSIVNIFSQYLPARVFDRCVARGGNKYVKHFT